LFSASGTVSSYVVDIATPREEEEKEEERQHREE
jgi:hypothetical protein